jgi:hypothetical protein
VEKLHRKHLLAAALIHLRDLLAVVGITAVFFLLFNWWCLSRFLDKPLSQQNYASNYWLGPDSEPAKFLYPKMFGLSYEEAKKLYDSSPTRFQAHPKLHFIIQNPKNRYFQIGLEGIRYEEGWTDEFVRRQLESGQGIWFFGGSTTQGHGLRSQETIPAILGKLLEQPVLNLGCGAYDQIREVDKLVYLLMAGYRPKAVIFLDGWNDLIASSRSNMRAQDRIIYHGYIKDRGNFSFTLSDRLGLDFFLSTWLQALPFYRLIHYRPETYDPTKREVLVNRDSFTQGLDFPEAEFMHHNFENYLKNQYPFVQKNLIATYKKNIDFVTALGTAFKFKPLFFYQPIGLFYAQNPFVQNGYEGSIGAKELHSLQDSVRNEIHAGKLDFFDLTNTLPPKNNLFFLDVAHYSPLSAEIISRNIQDIISGRIHSLKN